MPKYQKKETASGTVWRYQYTDPTTGERKSLTAPSVAELEHARRKLREARSMVAVGISPRWRASGCRGEVIQRASRSATAGRSGSTRWNRNRGGRRRATAGETWTS